ncbi:hypothetical protein WJX81_004473 [Elliptochloris bilobata]|uniref:Tr-type G domain-containing protein n=1 Tax=Elliptochloris bilobata TaxID=381761 RepID=A0AAW1RCG8_9CHLO
MFEHDFSVDDLDLGARRTPTKWVAVAPPLVLRTKQRPPSVRRRCSESPAASRGVGRAPAAQPRRKPDAAAPDAAAEAASGAKLSEGESGVQESGAGGQGAQQALDWLPPENDFGNVEYKLRLKQPLPGLRFQQLVTQMHYRLSEGAGECFYYVGVTDEGYPRGLPPDELGASLATLEALAAEAGCGTELMRQLPGARGRACALLRVHRLAAAEAMHVDLRIAVAGGADAGKSTLVAVLSQGARGRPGLDDGRGAARLAVLRHKHEIESGRTSSICQQVVGYDSTGRVLNYSGVAALTQAEIAAASHKVLCFIDLGGHERYLKTAVYGLTCMLPDAVLLCVSARGAPQRGAPAGSPGGRGWGDHGGRGGGDPEVPGGRGALLPRAAREHLAVALALDVPVAVVITQVDVAPTGVLAATVAEVRAVLGAAAAGAGVAAGVPAGARGAVATPLVTSEEQALQLALRLRDSSLAAGLATGAPGAGPAPEPNPNPSFSGRPPVVPLFAVSVVAGTVVAGAVRVGQRLLLGPTARGAFAPVTVTCIQRAQLPVGVVRAGQHATLAMRWTGVTAGADMTDELCKTGPSNRGHRDAGVGGLQHGSSAEGDPPGPPSAPEGGTGSAGSGLHWAPEPARWELRSRSAPPAAAACSPPSSRKGTVLLDEAWHPRTVVGSSRSAAGSLGRWAASGSGSDSPGGSSGDARARGVRRRVRVAYTPVVHCGSVRQAARVEITARGHEVTLVLPASNVAPLQAKGYDLRGSVQYNDTELHAAFHLIRSRVGKKPWGGLYAVVFRRILPFMLQHCEALVADKEVMQRMQDFGADVLLADQFMPCSAVLAARLGGVPIVALHTGAPFLPFQNTWWAGSGRRAWLPAPLSYVPQTGAGYMHPMTLKQRLHNSYMYTVSAAADYVLLRPVVRDAWRRFGIDAMKPAREAILLICADFAIEPPQPMPPHVKMVGAILTRPADPLPADLEDFMEGSGDAGVVLAASGTHVARGGEVLRQQVAAFAALPARVLWKLTEKEQAELAAPGMPALGANIKVATWLPQNDVLGHPRTRAFLTHGGANSMYEAAFHGVPLAAFHGVPLVTMPGHVMDQEDNAVKAARLGFGIPIYLGRNFSADVLAASLARVLSEPEFRVNAARVAAKMHARRRSPAQESVDWIEHVVATGGEPYLRTPEEDLPWAVRHSLDVAAVWAAAAALLVMLLARAARLLARLGGGGKAGYDGKAKAL